MDENPELHRDDIPMELAENLVEHLKDIHSEKGKPPLKVRFIGDLTDEEKSELPDLMEIQKKLYKHLVECFTKGVCHICGVKFPGEWPPNNDENWDLQGWIYYDSENEKDPPLLVCPKCEKRDMVSLDL